MNDLGSYKLLEKIDEGGMATVYKGLQVSLNRPVAVKILLQKLTDHQEIVERFKRESLIIGRLSHPNIIHVIDRGITRQGMPYFIMDYVEGSDLHRLVRSGKYSINEKLDIIIQVCKALSYAHKNGVIHRDIKPANILIDKYQNIKVTDFGIAQFYDEDPKSRELTKTGITMGSPSYMSPEQKVALNEVSAASDIYSLGVVIYELLTGEKPLGHFKAPSQLNPDISKNLDAIILKCLEPKPENRFPSADELKDALLQELQGAHIKHTRRKEAIKGVAKMEDIFDLLDIIKEHKFGIVYLFRHKENGQLMIVKKYDAPLGGFKEAKLLNTLKHKNIINIYGVSGTESLYVIVMEYISGGSLKDRLVRPHKFRDVLKLSREICEGLSFAHKNRIIHGNLRPSNILITSEGRVKITDFGLKEHYSSDKENTNWYNVNKEPRSGRVDIFAVGVMMYEMLTGSTPTWRNGVLLPHSRFAKQPPPVRKLITRMISKNRSDRFATFDHVIENLDEVLTSEFKRPVKKKTSVKTLNNVSTRKKQPYPLVRLFFLFSLLFTTGVVYLLITGKMEYYINIIQNIFHH